MLPKNHFGGLNEKPSGGKFTFTTQCVGTAASDGLSALMSTGTTMKRGLYFSTTAATGTDAKHVTRTIVIKIISHNDQTRVDRFKATVKRTKALRAAGYHVIEAWSCEVGEIDVELPRPQTQSYPYAILYDFEAYGDKDQRKEPTDMLTIENAHVPTSGTPWLMSPHTSVKKKPSGTGPQVHGGAGAAREKHSDQSTSGVRARRREDASKNAAHQN